MIEIGGLFRAGLPPAVAAITTLLMIVTTVLAAEEIPATTPEEVGMSPWFVAAGKDRKGGCRSTAWCRRSGRSPSTIC